MEIRKSTESDLNDVLDVETQAFGNEKSPEIAELVNGLLIDPTAIGHILFTRAYIADSENPVSSVILAPLAVIPEAQSQGVGGQLIKAGLRLLTDLGVELVFVLGHPEYYPRHGFKPAGAIGFEAPYPIPEIHANAWMVQELRPGVIDNAKGKVMCADVLNKPEHWRE